MYIFVGYTGRCYTENLELTCAQGLEALGGGRRVFLQVRLGLSCKGISRRALPSSRITRLSPTDARRVPLFRFATGSPRARKVPQWHGHADCFAGAALWQPEAQILLNLKHMAHFLHTPAGPQSVKQLWALSHAMSPPLLATVGTVARCRTRGHLGQ